MKTQLIVGMPDTGKSTYIAALRHILLHGEVETELEMAGLADDEEHLNRLADRWARCEAMERTKPSDETWVKIKARHKSTREESLMIIPDLRGETFERPAVTGNCPKDLYNALISSDGILLFTNVNHAEDMLLIDELGNLCDEEEIDEETKNFRPDDMPEEVKIVEFLQIANRRPLDPKRRKLALIASAWDVIEAEKDTSPEAWLAEKRPMLNQFLSHNTELWDLRVYGVSAQGGQFPEKKEAFAKLWNQSERVRIIGHGASSHDLSAPLCWLMTPS